MYWPLIGGFIAVVLITILIGWIMDSSRRGEDPSMTPVAKGESSQSEASASTMGMRRGPALLSAGPRIPRRGQPPKRLRSAITLFTYWRVSGSMPSLRTDSSPW